MKDKTLLPDAINVITDSLKSEDYFYGWQSNIAVAFMDEYRKSVTNTHMLPYHVLHGIANRAAKNFLNSLIKQSNLK